MTDEGFLARVRDLGARGRAVRAPSQFKGERTRVFIPFERLLAFFEQLPAQGELEVPLKKDRQVVSMRRSRSAS